MMLIRCSYLVLVVCAFKLSGSTDYENGKAKKWMPPSVVYTRWGRTECPEGTDLVMPGFVGGAYYSTYGSAEPICLTTKPEWGFKTPGQQSSRKKIYGAEYKFSGLKDDDERKELNHHDVPCAICRRRYRSVVQMFPGRKKCVRGWRMEYTGYLMTGYYASRYTCLDAKPEAVHGGRPTAYGVHFYPVEGICGSLKCPPYKDGYEITCVVCSL